MRKPSRRAISGAAAGSLFLICLAIAILLGSSGSAPLGPWEWIARTFGQAPDTGPVDFAALTPVAGAGLFCPANLCPAAAQAQASPVFTISADRLAAKLRRHALGGVGVEEIATGDPLRLRFIRRSLLLRLPEVFDAEIVARSSGAASLALYGRPLVPALDFGAARARTERWMEALGR